MAAAFRVLLLLLAGCVGWSALKHWAASAEMVAHYHDVGLGENGRIVVACLQSAACLGLLVTRLQVVAACVLGFILFGLFIRNLLVTQAGAPWLPLLMALWALIPAFGLMWSTSTGRVRASGGAKPRPRQA